MSVRPAKTQISLGIHPVWSESSLSAWRKLGSLATHWAHSNDSDQTGRTPGWSESSLGAHSFYWFCHVAAHMMTQMYDSDKAAFKAVRHADKTGQNGVLIFLLAKIYVLLYIPYALVTLNSSLLYPNGFFCYRHSYPYWISFMWSVDTSSYYANIFPLCLSWARLRMNGHNL